MIKGKIFIGFYGIVLTVVLGCTSNKNNDVPDLSGGISTAMDTIIAKMEFVPLRASDISPSIERLLKGKVSLHLPASFSSDSSEMHLYIGDLAVTNAYITWGEKFNITELQDPAIVRSASLFEKLNQSELNEELSFIGNNDSLIVYLNNFLETDSLTHLQAYYEAISWLENLYITLNFSENVSDKKEYNNVIVSQLNKGGELLDYLYDFQDYPPISDFSILMLDILECKNHEINVSQLKDLVGSLRENCYQKAQ